MAVSNRDRIGKMFELLAPALDEFIATSVAAKGPAADADQEHPAEPQLRLVSIRRRDRRVGHGYCKELREARNEWAHNKSLSDDDAYHCLDTAERLLGAVGAAPVADEVEGIRLGLRGLTADKDDRKVLQAAVVTPGSAGLRPCREVLAPHDDVATGNFQAAEFAADHSQDVQDMLSGARFGEPGRRLASDESATERRGTANRTRRMDALLRQQASPA